MDPLPSSSSPTSTSPQLDAPRAAAEPVKAPPPLSAADELLVQALTRRGLLTGEQVRQAQRHSMEHDGDLRRSILELNLISPEVLNQLAFERLSTLMLEAPIDKLPATRPAEIPDLPLSPDRTQHHRDVRKELQECVAHVPLARPGQPDPGARVRLPGHGHPF